MKPHVLTVEAFGPYRDETVVDFDAVSEDGLFLIYGPTGSGKTYLLDALTFALYGGVPGVRETHTLKSEYADPSTIPTVTLTFTVGQHRYLVERSVGCVVPKKRSQGTTTKTAKAKLACIDDPANPEPLASSIKKTNAAIIELVGLDQTQFQQVIMLPQGGFAEVLRARSDDREALLKILFNMDRFDVMTDWFSGHASVLGAKTEAAVERHETLTKQAAREWATFTETEFAADTKITDEDFDRFVADIATEADTATAELAQATEALAEARTAEQTAAAAVRAWDTRRAAETKVAEFRSKQATVDKAREFLAAAVTYDRYRDLSKKLGDAGQALAAAVEQVETANKEARATDKTVVEMRAAYLDGYAAELASQLASHLVDGQPCLVCGSTSHPGAASPAATATSVTEAEVDAAAHAAHAATVAATTAVNKLATIRETETAATHEAAEYLGADTEYLPELLHETNRRLDNARAVMLAVAEGTEFDPDTTPREPLTARVAAYDQNLAAVVAVLDQLGDDTLPEQRPDPETARHEADTAQKQHSAAVRRSEATQLAAQRMARYAKDRAALAAELDQHRVAAETAVAVADRYAGKAIPKVSLQRWMLATYLTEICGYANTRLQKMTSGRYMLRVNTDPERNGRQSGLSLVAEDAYTGGTRDVASLSGGETFQASLALALGVADVVQAHHGGLVLDGLFIDEGFGSLDEDTLQLAINELDCLRSGGRTVGLISHVEALRTHIRCGIEVEPSPEGSAVHLHGTDSTTTTV